MYIVSEVQLVLGVSPELDNTAWFWLQARLNGKLVQRTCLASRYARP
jgi:hypothetical protein